MEIIYDKLCKRIHMLHKVKHCTNTVICTVEADVDLQAEKLMKVLMVKKKKVKVIPVLD
jgi:hypothetical protein